MGQTEFNLTEANCLDVKHTLQILNIFNSLQLYQHCSITQLAFSYWRRPAENKAKTHQHSMITPVGEGEPQFNSHRNGSVNRSSQLSYGF